MTPARLPRVVAQTAALLAIAAGAYDAAADPPPDKARCLASYEQGQRLRAHGELRRARAELVTCSSDTCPAALRPDCVKWLDEVERAIPSLVVVARDANGVDVVDVEVRADGEVLAERIDGRAIRLDPGEHTLTFERQGAPPVTQRVILHEGDRTVPVEVRVPDVAPPVTAVTRPAPTSVPIRNDTPLEMPKPKSVDGQRPVPAATYALGGLSALALASFAYFAIRGRQDQTTLDHCRPNCFQSDVDAVHTKYIVADVSLITAIITGGIAAVLFITRPSTPNATVSARASHSSRFQ